MVLLIDNYDSFSYNLYQLIGTITNDIRVIRNDAMTISEIEQLAPTHIIISPGPGKPSDAGICEAVIDYFKDETNFNWDKCVKDFIKTDCLTVAPTQYIHTVAEMAMSRKTDEVYNNIFVVDENKYVGFISIRDLFIAILNKNN